METKKPKTSKTDRRVEAAKIALFALRAHLPNYAQAGGKMAT